MTEQAGKMCGFWRLPAPVEGKRSEMTDERSDIITQYITGGPSRAVSCFDFGSEEGARTRLEASRFCAMGTDRKISMSGRGSSGFFR